MKAVAHGAGLILALSLGARFPEPLSAQEIVVLSNRADLISGGDALVEINLPGGTDPARVDVRVDGRSIRSAFQLRADGRFYGLVTGLREGPNVLTLDTPGTDARITLVNHTIGGPVFSGPQLRPWQCDTTAEPSLGPPSDEKCNAETRYRYLYRTTGGEFAPYDPASARAPGDLATTTTDEGVTVPYIVRVERGTMNRGIHEIAVLHDQSKSWSAWDRQPQWNRKLLVLYGAGTSQVFRQGTPVSVMNHEALSAGFAVATSSMLINGQRSNFVTAAETTMMLKEHITERYGQIRYTIGQGSSGGALLQHLIADSYPGLLDGLRPTQDWTESISGAYREFADSGVLLHAFNGSPLTYTDEQRGAIGGWGAANVNVFDIESNRLPDYNRPDDGTRCAGPDSYDPVGNPGGIRCTFQDFMVGVLGRRQEDGFANPVFDNVGVQYGLLALNSGQITPAQFLDVNLRAGGFDVNGKWQAQRSEIDPGVAALLHRTGQVTFGRQLGKVAELAIRGTNNNDYHYPFRTYVHRNRLISANGHADNHVYWTSPPATESTLKAMDRWLTAVEGDRSSDPIEIKVVRNKPADLVSACWIDGVRTPDGPRCDAAYPHFREPRTVAGDLPTLYTMKCRLKPIERDDYDVQFTDAQWSALRNLFAGGVCDFPAGGVGFQPNIPWLNYADGAGGLPLGDPPTSTPLR